MMKLNIIFSYLLFVVMIMLFSPITFAPWSYQLRPVPPVDGLPRTCEEWIHYHGFTLDNAAANVVMAQTRDHILDEDAHKWAAIYAYVIDEVEPTNTPLPETFCNSLGATITLQYVTLKNYVQSCKGWIFMYRFSPDNVDYNVNYAKNRSPGKKYGISIWVDSYSSYLETYGETYKLTPTGFCYRIGKCVETNPMRGDQIHIMRFMSEYDTDLTCKEWIELYEFNDNIEYNYQKAINIIWNQSNNHISIQYWPSQYSIFLQTKYLSGDISDEEKKPKGYCTGILGDNNETATYNFHYDPDDAEPFDD